MEKSAASDACFPSLPTIPTPIVRQETNCAVLTNVGRLNHANIVTAVSDAADGFVTELADQAGDVSLLRRGATTSHNSRQLSRQRNELGAELVETQLKVSH